MKITSQKKKKSENDQSTGKFQSFSFFRPLDRKSEKNFP